MNFDVKDIPAKLTPLFLKAKKYRLVICILIVACIVGFLVARINSLAQAEPSQDAITEKLTTISRLKIDQESLNKIKQLEDQNIQVQSLFKQARENPFSE